MEVVIILMLADGKLRGGADSRCSKKCNLIEKKCRELFDNALVV
jgi:hypothetical protein